MKYILFCSLLMQCLPLCSRAQDTASYQDDEVFKKQVYSNVRADMDKGLIKGFIQLQAENAGVGNGQKVKAKLVYASEKKALPAPGIARQLREEVFVIWKFFRKTNTNIEGIAVAATAFAIDDAGTMVTNQHVMTKLLDKNATFYEMDSTYFLSDVHGNTYGIDKVLAADENADLAIFTVSNIHNIKMQPVPIGKEAVVGNPVYVLAHPEGFPYYFTSGMVARNSRYSQFGNLTERMEVTADYAVGASGGPIVNEFGGLIGVVSSTHLIYARNQENLQMVVKQTIPVRSVLAMMQ